MADHYLPSPAGVYTYQALETPDSIRLLTLHPSPRDAPITCTLTHIPMDQSPPYRALSYEWGSQPDLSFAPLTINNLPFSRPIQANLSHALVEIRSPNEDVTLWIDALCINQCSPLEKSHQVGLMSTIFRSATSVIAWLGPEADNSSVAMS
ncbi:heterokaryon incompatibility protein-domain-containing protein, partial [Immersiella caudata]